MRSKRFVFTLQPGEEVAFAYRKMLWKGKTRFQRVAIVETETFGKAIFLDGKPQSSELDHFIFNEILVHPPLLAHPRPRKIFVGGGGPGSCLHEVLRHRTVEHVTKCDIDGEAVAAYRRHLREWHGDAFEDARLNLVHMDARACLENSEEKYDCIVIDIPDPIKNSPVAGIFTREFFRLAKSRLNPGGVFVTQAGRTNPNNLEYHLTLANTMRRVFPFVDSYERHIPFYAENWGFLVAARDRGFVMPKAAQIAKRLRSRVRGRLRFYCPEIHEALFAKPANWPDLVRRHRGISTDRRPLFVT